MLQASPFDHLKKILSPGGALFGTTLLQGGVERTSAARALMALYNRRKYLTNTGDDLEGLRRALKERFASVELRTRGAVALFACR